MARFEAMSGQGSVYLPKTRETALVYSALDEDGKPTGHRYFEVASEADAAYLREVSVPGGTIREVKSKPAGSKKS